MIIIPLPGAQPEIKVGGYGARGILIGIEDPEEWWEEALLRYPLFQKRIAQARQSGREGKGITIEQLRAEL